MCDTLKYYDNIFKRWKMHENWGKSFFWPMDKKMSSPHIEWCIGKSLGLCTIFFKTSKWYLKFMLSHAVIKFRGFKLFIFSYKTTTRKEFLKLVFGLQFLRCKYLKSDKNEKLMHPCFLHYIKWNESLVLVYMKNIILLKTLWQ